MTRLVTWLLLSSMAWPAAAGEPGMTVSIVPDGGSYRVGGAFTVAAAAHQAWDVLTDYEGMPRFVSDITVSRVLRRGPQGPTIEQRGSGRFLFVSRSVTLTMAVVEERPVRISFRDVDGKRFRRYEGFWRIEPTETGSVVTYELLAEPDPSLGPRFAARRVLAANARRLLREVRDEIERRAAGGRS